MVVLAPAITWVRGILMTNPVKRKRQSQLVYHPKAADASRERLLRSFGIVDLDGPMPSYAFLGEREDGKIGRCDRHTYSNS